MSWGELAEIRYEGQFERPGVRGPLRAILEAKRLSTLSDEEILAGLTIEEIRAELQRRYSQRHAP